MLELLVRIRRGLVKAIRFAERNQFARGVLTRQANIVSRIGAILPGSVDVFPIEYQFNHRRSGGHFAGFVHARHRFAAGIA